MKTILSFLLIIISLNCYSQNQQNKVAFLERLNSPFPTKITEEGDTLYSIKFAVNLADSVNLDKVNIKIGKTYNGNEIFEGNYYFYSNPSNDTTFTRNQLRIVGDAGSHFQGIYFYKITVEDFQGHKYTPYIRQE